MTEEGVPQAPAWLEWVPEKAPKKWFIINVICALASVVVLVELLVASDEWAERPWATALYFVWDFGTTFVWVVETGLEVAYRKSDHTDASLSCDHWAELVVAAYLLLDSGHTLLVGKTLKGGLGSETFAVVVNIIFFVLIAAKTWEDMRAKQQQQQQSLEDDGDEAASETTRYGGIDDSIVTMPLPVTNQELHLSA
eukprot:CAMPEP_0198135372 /NCGR_PEP_ID=MMETSP1442-20131203/60555_1 /TAXON_ID= /ORGANISM="Craspedostauros australis, Strain CCMP3328" /LENGTH=195 /DNA_ID=CAMNT_0043796537 /DNA_START=315 /DNA_END=902 /DNA_ORIENTATION=+